MSDHELLLAISGMLDTKLKAEFQTLKAELHEEIQAVKAELYEEIQSVRAELYEEIHSVRAELQTVKAEQQTLKEELRCIKLYQENVIMPRLNTIEACYTGTYRRYARYVEKMEAVFQDVEVLKVVVAEHSAKLQKLA